MRKIIVLIGAILTALPAWGQSSLSYSFGPNLGTLNYQSQAVAYYCTGDTVHYTEYFYSNFVYVPSQGSSQSLGGSTTYTYNPTGYSGCPKSTPGPTLTFNESGYTIVVNPQCCGNINATITVPGYVNPKYVVVGVTYAPPGPQSFVDYTNSTLVSNTSSLNSSFSSSYSVRVSISTMGNLFGFIQAKQTSSSTSSY